MRCVTSRTAFSLEGRVFVSEWTLLIGVTLDASSIGASGQPCLFEFKTSVRIVTIAALHSAFENLVMEGHAKGRLNLAMTTQTKLGLALLQHRYCGDAGLFCL